MAKAKKEDAPQRLPGAESECISREQQEILEWIRKVKFRKKLLGGVDEVQLWKKLEELYGLYANAIRAERARYDALLANDLARSGAARRSPKRRARKAAARPLPLPLGELSPKVTERASRLQREAALNGKDPLAPAGAAGCRGKSPPQTALCR